MAHNAVIRQIMVGKGTIRCSDGLGLNLTLVVASLPEDCKSRLCSPASVLIIDLKP